MRHDVKEGIEILTRQSIKIIKLALMKKKIIMKITIFLFLTQIFCFKHLLNVMGMSTHTVLQCIS